MQPAPFAVGDTVTITDGPFKTFAAVVTEVEDQRLRLDTTVLGMRAPLLVETWQVARAG